MSGRKRQRPSASAAAAASRAKTTTERQKDRLKRDQERSFNQLRAAREMDTSDLDDRQKDQLLQFIEGLTNRLRDIESELAALEPQLQAERLQRLTLNLAGVNDETDEDSTSDEDSTPNEDSPPNKKSKGNNPRGNSFVLRL